MAMQPIDFEKYVQTLRETMAEAVHEAEILVAAAAKDRTAAADLHMRRQTLMNELDQQGRRSATDYMDQYRAQVKEQIRLELMRLVAGKLGNDGRTIADIAALLELEAVFVAEKLM